VCRGVYFFLNFLIDPKIARLPLLMQTGVKAHVVHVGTARASSLTFPLIMATSIITLDANEHPIKSVTVFKSNKAEVVRTFKVSLEVSL
jgi:hypothetical protein